MEYLALGRGFCRLRLTLQPRMVNFQGHPHGGVIFSLVDVAFGAACNSHGEPAVALSMTISYLTTVPAWSRLVAEAQGDQAGQAGRVLPGRRDERAGDIGGEGSGHCQPCGIA